MVTKGYKSEKVPTWKFIKDLHNSMVIDFNKKTVRCSPDAWFKFENQDRVFIFGLGDSNKKFEDPITKREKDITI